jgi:hypothetical protein
VAYRFLEMTGLLLIATGAIALWLLGGVALRWGGVAVIALGFIVALGVGGGSGLLLLVAGAALWLAGHLHYRVRHGDFKSGLAGLVLGGGP